MNGFLHRTIFPERLPVSAQGPRGSDCFSLVNILIISAIAFASAQRTFAPTMFRYGRQRRLRRRHRNERPFRALFVAGPGPQSSGSSHYLLVGERTPWSRRRSAQTGGSPFASRAR